jgi:hypothetical protein
MLLFFMLLRLLLGHQVEWFATLNAIFQNPVLIDVFFQVQGEEYHQEHSAGFAILEDIS